MINFDYLIGKKQSEAESLLNSQNISYQVIETKGFKDQDILLEPYVVRVTEKDGNVTLTIGLFKTTI